MTNRDYASADRSRICGVNRVKKGTNRYIAIEKTISDVDEPIGLPIGSDEEDDGEAETGRTCLLAFQFKLT